jgi:hypothetical protein
MKRLALVLGAIAGLLVPSNALAANVYEDYTKVGSVNRAYGDRYDVKAGYSTIGNVRRSGTRWNVYEGYSRVGYVKRSYGARFDIYSGYTKVGYVKRSGSRWDIHESYSKIGYVDGGTGAPAGGAALLLLLG